MFSIPGILGLVVFIYVKPQEFVPGLETVPFLYLLLGLAMFGVVLDLKLGQGKIDLPPHFAYVAAFFPWACFTYLAKAGGGGFVAAALDLAIAITLFVVLSLGVKSFKTYEVVLGSVLASSVFVALVGFHQGFAPMSCAVQEGNSEALRPDGRPCAVADECYSGDAEPGADYRCEKQGLFGTVSVGGGRVRYRGVLKDPNEVALAIGVAVPILLARVERKRSLSRMLALLFGLLLIGTTIVFTKSRGGMLVFMAALGAYFVKKHGAKGLVAGGVLAAPLALLGGRSGSEASSSSEERTEILVEGLRMFRENPGLGVGYDQFTQYHHLTAHNSYLLALSEMGPLGLFLFFAILYVSFKIVVSAVLRYDRSGEAIVARTWSMALLASFTGIAVGIFFLSFTYHHVLWIYFGLSGALYGVIRRHDPSFEVKVGLTEHLLLGVAVVAFAAMLKVMIMLKGY